MAASSSKRPRLSPEAEEGELLEDQPGPSSRRAAPFSPTKRGAPPPTKWSNPLAAAARSPPPAARTLPPKPGKAHQPSFVPGIIDEASLPPAPRLPRSISPTKQDTWEPAPPPRRVKYGDEGEYEVPRRPTKHDRPRSRSPPKVPDDRRGGYHREEYGRGRYEDDRYYEDRRRRDEKRDWDGGRMYDDRPQRPRYDDHRPRYDDRRGGDHYSRREAGGYDSGSSRWERDRYGEDEPRGGRLAGSPKVRHRSSPVKVDSYLPARPGREDGEASSDRPRTPSMSPPPRRPEEDGSSTLSESGGGHKRGEIYRPPKIKNRPTRPSTGSQPTPIIDAPPPPPPPPDTTPPPPPDSTPPPPPTPPLPPPSDQPALPIKNRALEQAKLQSTPHAPNRNLLNPATRPATPADKQEPPVHVDFASAKGYRRMTAEEELSKLHRCFVGSSGLEGYDVGIKLGEGTFGVVTKGVEVATKRPVALKKLITHNPRDGVSMTTIREIKIIKSLSHPNVVPIIDMVVQPRSKGTRQDIFMVFPFMDHDLCGLLANKDFKMGHSTAKMFMKQILEGMAYIHANNFIHRDIKTANILVDQHGVCMIADFGLARPWTVNEEMPRHMATEYTNMVVTRWYRAPELLLGEVHYTPAVDMWSLGCVLGEMYNREPILAGESDQDQLVKIFGRCGPLNQQTFPGWEALPGFPDAIGHRWDRTPLETPLQDMAMKHWSTSMDSGGANLLLQLLRLDPNKRLTASDALDHEWFWVSPLPLDPRTTKLGVESSHEMTKSKRIHEVHAPAHQNRNNHHQHPQYQHQQQQHHQQQSYGNPYSAAPARPGPGWAGGPPPHQPSSYGRPPPAYNTQPPPLHYSMNGGGGGGGGMYHQQPHHPQQQQQQQQYNARPNFGPGGPPLPFRPPMQMPPSNPHVPRPAFALAGGIPARPPPHVGGGGGGGVGQKRGVQDGGGGRDQKRPRPGEGGLPY